MIITISGTPGSGKGTVGKELAKILNCSFFSMGDIRREYAKQKNITLEHLNKLAETNPESDKLVDEYLVVLGHCEKNIIVDSRLGFHFIPNSFKVFLDADEKVRAIRITNTERGVEKYATVNDAIKKLRERQKSDIKRYMNLYGINPYDINVKKYDLVLDTTNMTPLDVANIIALEQEKFSRR